MKAKRFVSLGIMALFLVTAATNATAAPSGAIGQGNISVYKGGQLADTFTGQNPVEDEALLVCDGKCMIKSPGISLIGVDGAKLAIKKDQEMFNLLVNEGRVDFIITDSISQVAFYLPNGEYTVADIMFNANTSSPVRGYMQVAADGTAEVGVLDGRMVFSTGEGAKTVDSNNRMLLAMADVQKDDDDDKAGAVVLGGAGAGAAEAGGTTAATIETGSMVAGGIITAGVATAVVLSQNKNDVANPGSLNQ